MRSERQLATAISRKKELVEYQYLKTKLELEGQVASAKRTLEQVQRDNEAALAQAEAATLAADEAFKKEEERLERYRQHVESCKVYAPTDGMVAYAVEGSSWRREEIRAGAPVRLRQRILSIPNLKRMQVKTAIHESALDQVQPGLSATIRVDAFPERSYRGSVASVAVLPDQGSMLSSDTKVYETIVTIDEEVEQLKPGMTAVVQIHAARLEKVNSVPVQAIVQIGQETWCYVGEGGEERRPVTVGLSNDKFVEIREGLEEGETVVLNPEAILDTEKDASASPEPEGSDATPASIAGPAAPDEKEGQGV
jgi:RND family efflux transporter MFP subunit